MPRWRSRKCSVRLTTRDKVVRAELADNSLRQVIGRNRRIAAAQRGFDAQRLAGPCHREIAARPLRCEASLPSIFPSQEALGAAAGAPRHLSRAAVSDKMLAERVVHELIPDNFHSVTEPCHALSGPAPMAAKQLERRTRRTRRCAAVRAVWACSWRARVESGATSRVAGSSSR